MKKQTEENNSEERKKEKETNENRLKGMVHLYTFCLKGHCPANSRFQTLHQQHFQFWGRLCYGSVLYRTVPLGPDPRKHLD